MKKILAVVYDLVHVAAPDPQNPKKGAYWDWHVFKVGLIETFSEVPPFNTRMCESIEMTPDGTKIIASFNDGTAEEIEKWDKIIYADEQAYSRVLPPSFDQLGEENPVRQEPNTGEDAVQK